MIKSILTFLTLTLFSLSVFATEPPTDSASMFDCAVYSGLGKLPNQKTYITAGLFLYDKEHGVKAYHNWANSEAGASWIQSRKQDIVNEINSWGVDGKDATLANFREKVKDCDTRYGMINQKTNLKDIGIELGYIPKPAEGELPSFLQEQK